MTLLTEPLLALRKDTADGFSLLLNLGLQEPVLDMMGELTQDFPVPLLSKTEADRIVAWYWG